MKFLWHPVGAGMAFPDASASKAAVQKTFQVIWIFLLPGCSSDNVMDTRVCFFFLIHLFTCAYIVRVCFKD
jgi:hypothetical protein